jgi:arylsulfatase A-like enzyme
MKLMIFTFVAFLTLSACSHLGTELTKEPMKESMKGSTSGKPPNIILIVADDMGYGDLGAFGGDISTPNLDALANEGARLTAFHTQSTCSPTRSMLLTGVDNHLNGMGTMLEDRLPHHEGLPGYVGVLNNEVVTVATLLQDAGYHTYMSGKWHLGFEAHQTPHARGFEHTFALLNGGANHFSAEGNNSRQPISSYSRDGGAVVRPAGYSSDIFTDEMLALLSNSGDDEAPFFAFLAFTAPHWPLHAPAEMIKKYIGKFDQGWDAVRAERFVRMKALGLIPAHVPLPERIAEVPAWESLSSSEQKNEAKKMAIYAAMVDNLDSNVGRLIHHLKDTGQYENSVIIFMSDNGADPYDRSQRAIYKAFFAEKKYDNSNENMGAGNSYTFAGPGWAQVSSVHQSHYKFLPSEGGTRSPTIVRMPGITTEGSTLDGFASLLDITPTLLDIAGVDHPEDNYEGRAVHALSGRSMMPYLQGQTSTVYGAQEPVSFELFGHGAVYMGPWKAMRIRAPWRDNSWSLYNLANDPGEQINLAQSEPEILAKLLSAFSAYEAKNGVIAEPENATAYPNKPTYVELKNGS